MYYYINTENDSDDRYDKAKFMEYTDVYDPLTSYFIDEMVALSTYGTYAVTEEEFRPDLLSYNIYGTTSYWWMLMIFNGLMTANELLSGMTIKFPSKDAIETLYFRLKALEASNS